MRSINANGALTVSIDAAGASRLYAFAQLPASGAKFVVGIPRALVQTNGDIVRLAPGVPRTHNNNVVTFRKPHNTSILERGQEILWNRQR